MDPDSSKMENVDLEEVTSYVDTMVAAAEKNEKLDFGMLGMDRSLWTLTQRIYISSGSRF